MGLEFHPTLHHFFIILGSLGLLGDWFSDHFGTQMTSWNHLGTKMEPESFQVRKQRIFEGLWRQNPNSNFQVFWTLHLNSDTFWACVFQVRFLCDFNLILGPPEGHKPCKTIGGSLKIKVSPIQEKYDSRFKFWSIWESFWRPLGTKVSLFHDF